MSPKLKKRLKKNSVATYYARESQRLALNRACGEMVDTLVLGTSALRRGGSSPSRRTN